MRVKPRHLTLHSRVITPCTRFLNCAAQILPVGIISFSPPPFYFSFKEFLFLSFFVKEKKTFFSTSLLHDKGTDGNLRREFMRGTILMLHKEKREPRIKTTDKCTR